MFKLLNEQQFLALYPNFLWLSKDSILEFRTRLKKEEKLEKDAIDEYVFESKISAVTYLFELMNEYGLENKYRQAYFIANAAQETGNFTRYEENLNYSSARIATTFKHKFVNKEDTIRDYAHNPEKLANFIYADLNGNGNEASGDGWKYRGGGMLQLTGSDNYIEVLIDLDCNVSDIRSVDKSIKYVAESGLHYFKHKSKKGINMLDYCDRQDFRQVCRLITGSDFSLNERKMQLQRLARFL